MNRYLVILIVYIVSMSFLTACKETNNTKNEESAHQQPGQDAQKLASADVYSGTIVDTMDAGSYTYVQVDLGDKKIWAAGPTTAVNVGDVQSVSKQMPMNNFHSKALNRDFELIYFVSSLGSNATSYQQKPHQDISKTQPISVDVKKAQNGNTIEEIYVQKQQLSGKTVRVRGLVVKYTSDVLGKDWIHIRDNSSSSDLTITTEDKVKQGDVVLAEGKLNINRDFGYGYVYKVIMEEAKVTVE